MATPHCKEYSLYSGLSPPLKSWGISNLHRSGEWILAAKPLTLLFPSIHGVGIALRTGAPAVKFSLPSFNSWQILRLFPFHFWNLLMAIFSHFPFCSNGDLNQAAIRGRAGTAPRRNVTSNRQWTRWYSLLSQGNKSKLQQSSIFSRHGISQGSLVSGDLYDWGLHLPTCCLLAPVSSLLPM